jgi:hypothetical protein
MKKFLSVFIALAMAFSLFAGVGARTAKAATSVPAAIAGVTAPVTGATAVTTTTAGTGYTGAVVWAPTSSPFVASTTYTATITLTSTVVDEFLGVPVNYFTVTGATTVYNAAGPTSGSPIAVGATLVVTAVFPATAAALTQLTITAPTLTLSKVFDTTTTAAVTAGTLVGVVSPDVVTVTAAANYATAAVGTGKTIAVVYTLGGADAAKYIAPVNYTVATGVITAVPVVVAPAGTVTLTATQPAGTTSVLLSWTYSAADATAFNINRNGAVIAYVAASTTAYTDVTTVAGAFYTYFVTPVNTVGAGTQSYSVSILPTAATAATTTTGTLGIVTTGTFVGGVDGSGVLGVNGVATVSTAATGTTFAVNVTTAAVGSFSGTVEIFHATGLTSSTSEWATTGMKPIKLSAGTGLVIGDTIGVMATSTNGSGDIWSIDALGNAVVNVTTAAVGTITSTVYLSTTDTAAACLWTATGASTITLVTPVTLAVGDILTADMDQAVPATSATAFVIVSGTPVAGDVATVTWQDTTGASHSVSYTAVAADTTSANIASALSQLINALDVTTGNVDATVTGSVITMTQDVGGVAGNGKTLTGTTTAAVVPTLTVKTRGGLTQPAYVELGKTLQLVATDATGAVVSVSWTSSVPATATVSTSGLVTALLDTGVTVITAKSSNATGVFAVVAIPVQLITSLTINLVPAMPVSTTSQQFGAIASNATYSALDYTTQSAWTDALAVASIAPTTGLLTYSTDEMGNIYASAGGITATASVKIATGVVTLTPVVGPVTKVIVLTIGNDIVTVDGKATSVDAAPEIVDGRTFVPIRFIAETFGSTVTWLPETKGITVVLGATTIGLQIGNKTVVINSNVVALEAAPYIKNSRTMVPLRVISESFGGDVAWDPALRTITITYVVPVAVPVV